MPLAAAAPAKSSLGLDLATPLKKKIGQLLGSGHGQLQPWLELGLQRRRRWMGVLFYFFLSNLDYPYNQTTQLRVGVKKFSASCLEKTLPFYVYWMWDYSLAQGVLTHLCFNLRNFDNRLHQTKQHKQILNIS